MSQRRFTVHPLVVRRLSVLRIVDVTPRMRRVTLGGPELGRRQRDELDLPAFVSSTFDDHVKVLLASDGPLEDVLPIQLAHGIEWTPSATRIARDYTPRRVTATELDLDFVLHSGSGSAGPAEEWASTAGIGDELAIVGPKSSTILPEVVDRVVLVADETGLPAVGRFLDERPVDAPVTAVLSIGHASARQDLAVRPGDEIAWVVAAPGDPEPVMATIRALEPSVWEGRPYVWAGAEARSLLPLRRLVAREHGVPKDRIDITGYWHLRDEEEPAVATAEHSEAAPAELPSAPVTWLALRAALQLGVLDVLDQRASTLEDAEQRLELAAGSLTELVGVLVQERLLLEQSGVLYPSDAVRELLVDEHEREELDGPEADLVLALADLAPALRRGTSAWEVGRGRTFAASLADAPGLIEELGHEAEGLAYLMPGLVALPLWESAPAVTVRGPGREPVASALQESTSVTFRPLGEPVDVLVDSRALTHLTDEEAATWLRESRGRAGTVVLVEPSRPDALGPGAAQEALLQVARTGAGPRSTERLGRIAEQAGWAVMDAHDLGWGVTAVVLGGLAGPAA